MQSLQAQGLVLTDAESALADADVKVFLVRHSQFLRLALPADAYSVDAQGFRQTAA